MAEEWGARELNSSARDDAEWIGARFGARSEAATLPRSIFTVNVSERCTAPNALAFQGAAPPGLGAILLRAIDRAIRDLWAELFLDLTFDGDARLALRR